MELEETASSRLEGVEEVEEVIFGRANEMREMRMSMIANFKQFICVYECCLQGALEEIALETTTSSD